MTVLKTTKRLAAALLVASIAAACGGSTPAGSSGASPGASTAEVKVAISGSQTETITKAGGCGPDVGDAASWNAIFQTDSGKWMLDITIEKSLKAGTYSTGFHDDGKASIMFFEGSGGATYTSGGEGSVTVDADQKGGSIATTLTNAVDGKTVDLAGHWICES
jgi:hypothetical protein